MWFEQRGLRAATGPMRMPSDVERGIMSRVVIPVGCGGTTYGYLWLIDDAQTLDESHLDEIVVIADRIGVLLRQEESSRQLETEMLLDLLSHRPELRRVASEDLANRGRVALGNTVAVAVVRGRYGQLSESVTHRLQVGLRSAPHHMLRCWAGDHAVLLEPVSGESASGLRSAIDSLLRSVSGSVTSQAFALVAGIGDSVPKLTDAARSYEQAERAARVAAAVPQLGPVAEWRLLGAFRALTMIPGDQSLVEAVDPRVRQLAEVGDPDLLRTVEVFLDTGCDVKSASAALSVHRGTLYYRLRKAENLSGLSLESGFDRLTLHLGLQIMRLQASWPD
ncbi:PucR family transcriptional regulator [Kribbella turkmenica]|uniref:PucR family transcriptional regulator n=1 Tax=Kribbella turkmenica TaxID=2530375 RepID=A0A4V2YGF1_9ACTN|nr:PucR family transcriptional regulator [Kribbella turkmenica]TDD26817.1 PucR family transcriptional regulator [Kribbella turkmenica]